MPCADNRARAGGGAAGLDLMFNYRHEITMNRETIEKAGRDYALDQLEIVGLPGLATGPRAVDGPQRAIPLLRVQGLRTEKGI